MRIVIKNTKADTGKWTADYIINKIKAFAPTPDKPFVMGLPTGSSPMPVYEEWIRRYKAGEISFKNVVTFNMDEYVNLPEDHSESYHSFMYTNLFNHIDIPAENINILNGNAADLEKVCKDYEAKIKQYGGIELFLGGIGPDGHIASLFPHHLSIDSEDPGFILVKDSPKPPPTRISMSPSMVRSCSRVFLFFISEKKREAYQRFLDPGLSYREVPCKLATRAADTVICSTLMVTE